MSVNAKPIDVLGRSRSGLRALKSRVRVGDMSVLDRRSKPVRVLLAWRAELIASLGGVEAVSPQKAALVDMVVRTRLLIDHADAFLFSQRSLIYLRKKAFYPVVQQRQGLVDSLSRLLAQLGLERQGKPVLELCTYISQKDGAK